LSQITAKDEVAFEKVEEDDLFYDAMTDAEVKEHPGDETNTPAATNGTIKMPVEDKKEQNDMNRSREIEMTLLGDEQCHVSSGDYYKICPIADRSQLSCKPTSVGLVCQLLPYLIQRVKMRGCRVLQADRLKEIITNEPHKSQVLAGGKSRIRGSPVARIDCISCMMCMVDPTVACDLLNTMSQFPMSLPLVIRNIRANSIDVLHSLLKGIVVKWDAA
jgi:hypothetical protein